MKTKQASTEPTIIFLHIPKTAGSTLYCIMDRNYPAPAIYTLLRDGSYDDFKCLSDARRSQIRLFRGHMGFGIHEFLPGPCAYFTLLRDLIRRTISYYHFICRTPRHYCHAQVTSARMSLKDLLESKIDRMADNAHVRLLSGMETGQEAAYGGCTREMLEVAKTNLRECFAVVGLTEGFDRTLMLLKRAFGWQKLVYARQNVTARSLGKADLSPDTLEAVTRSNLLDVELYEYARALFEEQVRQQGTSFAGEVASFQAPNRLFAPLVYVYWQAKKVSIRVWVRRWIRRWFKDEDT